MRFAPLIAVACWAIITQAAPTSHPDDAKVAIDLSQDSTSVTTESPAVGGGGDPAFLIHLLRTADLVDAANSRESSVLLEQVSHLVLKLEVHAQSLTLNGVEIPLLYAPTTTTTDDVPTDAGDGGAAAVNGVVSKAFSTSLCLKLNSVLTLRMPEASPFLPIGLVDPEALRVLAEHYFGAPQVVGATLRVVREPLSDSESEDSSASQPYKASVYIEIIEIDNHLLKSAHSTQLPLITLLVHPSATDPTQIDHLVTTITPPAPINLGQSAGSALLSAALDATRDRFSGQGLRGWMKDVGSKMKEWKDRTRPAAAPWGGRHSIKPCHHKQEDGQEHEGRPRPWFGNFGDEVDMPHHPHDHPHHHHHHHHAHMHGGYRHHLHGLHHCGGRPCHHMHGSHLRCLFKYYAFPFVFAAFLVSALIGRYIRRVETDDSSDSDDDGDDSDVEPVLLIDEKGDKALLQYVAVPMDEEHLPAYVKSEKKDVSAVEA